MKHKQPLLSLFSFVIIIFLTACGGQTTETQSEESTEVETETITEVQPIESPRQQAEGEIGGVKVAIDYGSPAVKGRKVWGGLEPYGEVWRAGANETTSIEFDKDIIIGGETVAAGKYGLYIIPNETEDWVIILNTDWNREEHGAWGAYNYSKERDVVRINVAPQQVEENQERLSYSVDESSIGFAWEKVRMAVPVGASGS